MGVFYGVADCHGVESFQEQKAGYESYYYAQRAMLNSHRHAVAYKAELSYHDAEIIERLVETHQPAQALGALKARATALRLADAPQQAVIDSWTRIPNPSLDPCSMEALRTNIVRDDAVARITVLPLDSGDDKVVDGVKRRQILASMGEDQLEAYSLAPSREDLQMDRYTVQVLPSARPSHPTMTLRQSESSRGRGSLRDRKRRKEEQNTRELARRKYAFQNFPKIAYEPGVCPKEFTDAVHTVSQSIVREHERLFPPQTVEMFHMARQHGFPKVLGGLSQIDASDRHAVKFTLAFGQQLLRNLPRELLDRYGLYCDVECKYGSPEPKMIQVRFRCLATAKTKGGTAYFSPYRPTIDVDGVRKVVAFYRHAIERIGERTVYDRFEYGSAGDLFGLLYCNFFEPCRVANEFGFSLYQRCMAPFFDFQYAKQILGAGEREENLYYRIGYCLPVIDRGLLIAKTLLTPGMRGTPECQLLNSAALSRKQRSQMKAQVDRQTMRDLVDHHDFSLLKWFHDNGVPQVVKFTEPLFRYD